MHASSSVFYFKFNCSPLNDLQEPDTLCLNVQVCSPNLTQNKSNYYCLGVIILNNSEFLS